MVAPARLFFLRVVLDTNVVVSALLFTEGAVGRVRGLWRSERIRPLIDRACTEELLRVLAYPKFGLEPDEISAVLEDYLPFAETVAARKVRLPRCRDAHDRKFLVLAASGHAEGLVTGDSALLELDDRVSFAIETPAALLARFAGS